jgi:hypothetical protein
MATIMPLLFTVATSGLLLVHVIFLFVALAGAMVAVNVCVKPGWSEKVVWLNVTPVTGIGTMVIWQVAVKPPSAVVAVIVALPAEMAVTTPVLLTVATSGSLLVHVTLVLVALAGCTVATRVRVSLMPKVANTRLRVTPVTGTRTVMVQVAVRLPSCVVAVMMAVPSALAVTTPLVTVATVVLLLVHVTVLFDAVSGKTVGVSVNVSFTVSDAAVWFSETEATGVVTVTTQVAV